MWRNQREVTKVRDLVWRNQREVTKVVSFAKSNIPKSMSSLKEKVCKQKESFQYRNGPVVEKRDIRTYVNSEDPDQPAPADIQS